MLANQEVGNSLPVDLQARNEMVSCRDVLPFSDQWLFLNEYCYYYYYYTLCGRNTLPFIVCSTVPVSEALVPYC